MTPQEKAEAVAREIYDNFYDQKKCMTNNDEIRFITGKLLTFTEEKDRLLGEAQDEIDRVRRIEKDWLQHDCGIMTEENKRLKELQGKLVESLTGLLKRYVGLVNSGDAGNWNPETESEVKNARKTLSLAKGES